MSDESTTSEQEGIEEEEAEKICFIIMPISDKAPYEEGHFERVYEHIIKPACKNAGFKPIRADDINKTNFIVKDVLQKILDSDMALCDVSGHNPNVMFELGIRQSFDLPVTIIKDNKTEGIFDISGIRYLEYSSDLRVDKVDDAIDILSESIKNTSESNESSLIEALSITPAKQPAEKELSPDTPIILDAIERMGDRIKAIEKANIIKSKRPHLIIKDQPSLQNEWVGADIIGNYENIHIGRKNEKDED